MKRKLSSLQCYLLGSSRRSCCCMVRFVWPEVLSKSSEKQNHRIFFPFISLYFHSWNGKFYKLVVHSLSQKIAFFPDSTSASIFSITIHRKFVMFYHPMEGSNIWKTLVGTPFSLWTLLTYLLWLTPLGCKWIIFELCDNFLISKQYFFHLQLRPGESDSTLSVQNIHAPEPSRGQ